MKKIRNLSKECARKDDFWEKFKLLKNNKAKSLLENSQTKMKQIE